MAEAQKRAESGASTTRITYRVHDGRRDAPWGPNEHYDVISCMFAVHYFFSSSKLATHFFRSCARVAKPGARLAIAYVDEDQIRDHLWGKPHVELPDFCSVETPAETPPPTGVPFPYLFHLDGSVQSLAEYSVPPVALCSLLASTGWKILLDERVVDFGHRKSMLVPSFEEGFAVSSLYRVLLAEKVEKK